MVERQGAAAASGHQTVSATQRSCCNPFSVVRKGSRNVLVSTYELYALEVLGRPTDVFAVPWIVWAHITGTFGFLIGSIFFLFHEYETIGLIIFAIASAIDGAACGGMTWKAYKRRKWISFAADLLLFLSCILFVITNIPPLYFDYRIPIVWSWTIRSAMFVVGCGLLQLVLVNTLGCWGAFITVPLEVTNIVGSIFFTVGSVLLFYPPLKFMGTWNYVLGSAVFLISSICSIIVCQLHAPSKRTYKLMFATTKSFDSTFVDGYNTEAGSVIGATASATPRTAFEGEALPTISESSNSNVGQTMTGRASRPVESSTTE